MNKDRKFLIIMFAGFAVTYIASRFAYDYFMAPPQRSERAVAEISENTTSAETSEESAEQMSKIQSPVEIDKLNRENYARKKKEMAFCDPEVKKFCKDTGWKDGVGACLFSHYDQLSNRCKNNITTSISDIKPCWDDLRTFCKDTKPGDGRLIKCLVGQMNSISRTCKSSDFMKRALSRL